MRGVFVKLSSVLKSILSVVAVVASVTALIAPSYHPYEMTRQSNSWIKQEPTLDDEMPKEFTVNHWVIHVLAHTADLKHQLSIAGWLDARGGSNSYMRLVLDGTYSHELDFAGKEFKVQDERPQYVKFIQGGVELIVYPFETRLLSIQVDLGRINFSTISRGLPLWLAKDKEQMLTIAKDQLGNASYVGGFGDVTTASGTIPPNQYVNGSFTGYGFYVHWWSDGINQNFIYWDALWIQQDAFYLMMWQSWNPNTEEIYVHSGFIGFPSHKLCYSFDDFKFEDHNGKSFEIRARPRIGKYERGFVDARGARAGQLTAFANPLVKWVGTLSFDGQTISIDTEGSGEVLHTIT